MDPEELASWLRLLQAEGVGPVTARTLLSRFGLPGQVLSASYGALVEVVPERVAQSLLVPAPAQRQAIQDLIDRTLAWLQQPGRQVITLADPAYPSALLETSDPPTLLYCIGNAGLLSRPALAVVGSRNASQQGATDAARFARTLSKQGYTVVSGLALGIDAAAHRGALECQGPGCGSTIAVIGTGADLVYPARNRALAHRIAEEGLILSEYPLGTPAASVNFPRRNRIISGLVRGVLVVEAAEQSGSLITARLAMEQGRDVFAIPGSIHSPLSKGCHRLIKQGAKLVESAEDVLEELRPLGSAVHAVTTASAPGTLSTAPAIDGELQTLLQVLGYDPVDTNTLAGRAGLDAGELARQLLMLEMQGLVEALPGARWRRLG